MPGDDRGGLHEGESLGPVRPHAGEQCPEGSFDRFDDRTPTFALVTGQLLPIRQMLGSQFEAIEKQGAENPVP